MDSACFSISLVSAIDLKPLICQKVSIHHLPGLCGSDKPLENQSTLESECIKGSGLLWVLYTNTWVPACLYIYTLFVLTSPNYNASPAVFTVFYQRGDSIRRLIDELTVETDYKLPWPLLSTALAEVESATMVPACKFPPRPVVGCLRVRSVDSSKALSSAARRCNRLGCLAEKWGLQAHPSSGVKTSRWFSDVSEGQISSFFAPSLH